jgi:hypothetical protein
MSEKKQNKITDCEPLFVADHEGYVAAMKHEQEKLDKRNRRKEKSGAVLHGISYVLLTPISIALSALSCVSKIVGGISAIGLPYGLYCAYKTVIQMKEGIAFADISQRYPVLLFVILPFTAFLVNLILDKTVDLIHRYT